MQDTDDIDLLRRYTRENSEEAFATLVARHIDKVYSVALRHGLNLHQAEEVTQAVFLILVRKSRRLGPRVILSGWLCQTARWAAMSYLRGEIRRTRREQEAQMQTLTDPSEADDWRRIAPLLDAAMARLNERDRHALILRYFDSKSLKEVGAVLGASEDAAKMRVNRALEKLRRLFQKRGVALPAAVLATTLSARAVQAAPPALAQSIGAASTATTSASTTALVAETIRFMAWTQAKTAAWIVAMVLLLASAAALWVLQFPGFRLTPAPDLQGAWEGVMRLDEAGVEAGTAATTRVVLRLVRTPDGYRATTDWIERGRRDVPMGRVVYTYPNLRLEWNPRQTWNLTVNAAGTELVLDHARHFIVPDPVVLKRTANPPSVPEPLAEASFLPRAGSDLQGYWTGTVDLWPEPLPVALKIAELPDATFRAEGDSPMQGANRQPLVVTYQPPQVTLALASGAGLFKGTVNDDNTEIVGTWTQGGESLPVTIRRADYSLAKREAAALSFAYGPADPLPGHWQGTWIVPFGDLKVPMRYALDIGRRPDGSYRAAVRDRDQFCYDDPIPATDFHYDPPSVSIDWLWKEGRFEGCLTNGTLAGTWFQGGIGFRLVFERSGSP